MPQICRYFLLPLAWTNPISACWQDAFLAQVREELVEMAKKFRKVSRRCEVLEMANEQWS